MRAFVLLAFLFCLLPLAVIGHDGYIAYNHPELGNALQAYRLSDLGWLWTTYSPDTFGWAKTNSNPAFWHSVVNPVLEQTALIVACLPLFILLIVRLFIKTSQRFRMPGGGKNVRTKGQPIKYNRK